MQYLVSFSSFAGKAIDNDEGAGCFTLIVCVFSLSWGC